MMFKRLFGMTRYFIVNCTFSSETNSWGDACYHVHVINGRYVKRCEAGEFEDKKNEREEGKEK